MALMLKLAVHCLVATSQPVDFGGDETVSLLQTKANKHATEGAPEAAHMKSLFPIEPPFKDIPIDTEAFAASQKEGQEYLEKHKDAFSSMQEEGESMMTETVSSFKLTEDPTGDVASGMRFLNVGTVGNTSVDIVVSVPDNYQSGKLTKRKTNGFWNGFARIHLQANTTQRMKVSVFKNGTDEPVAVPVLAMNMFGISAKKKNRWPLSVSQCVTTKLSQTWFGPELNETDGGCGGKTYTGVSVLKRKDQPNNGDAVQDKHCPAAMAFKWWNATEVELDLSVGEPKRGRAFPFIFTMGLTQCSFSWMPATEVKPVSKAELKAAAKMEKAKIKAEEKAAKKLAKENAKRARKSR